MNALQGIEKLDKDLQICQFYTFYIKKFIHIVQKMPAFEDLIKKLKSVYQIQLQLQQVQQKSKAKIDQIISDYRKNYNLQIMKIRRRNDLFILTQNKNEYQLQSNKITPFLQRIWQVQKYKNVILINQKKIYYFHLQKSLKALETVKKQYNQFVKNKRQQAINLRQKIEKITQNLEQFTKKYSDLADKKMKQGQFAQKKDQNLHIIPFLSQKIDKIFERQIPCMNISKKQLNKMKSLKNNIIGKIQFLLDLLKQKQQQKRQLQEQNDKEIQIILQKRQPFIQQVQQCKQKQKQAQEMLQLMKQQQKRHLLAIFKEKKKFDQFSIQTTEFKRTVMDLNKTIEGYRKKQEKMYAEFAKKPFDENQKIQVLIARDREKDQFQRQKKMEMQELQKQKKFFQSIDKQQQKRRKMLKEQFPQEQQKPINQKKQNQLMQSFFSQQKSTLNSTTDLK